MRTYFMKTERIGFSIWTDSDLELANQLWGDPEVTKYICASGVFSSEDIKKRLQTEIRNGKQFGIQYWPIFELETGDLIGCCGLRPFQTEANTYEIGFHLCKNQWGKGYATESAKAVIAYCFETLKADKLYVGHHPENHGSAKVVKKLGFQSIGLKYYEPTGLYHPAYEMNK